MIRAVRRVVTKRLLVSKRRIFKRNNQIVNKIDNMNTIRYETRKLFDNKDFDKNKQYFVGMVHTYPAWKKIFEVKTFSEFRTAMQKTSYSAQNPYGHTLAEFFKFENGTLVDDHVMNVGINGPNGPDKKNFLHFIPSSVYYFNNREENATIHGNQQGGILERSYLSLVFEVNENQYNMILDYYESLQKQMLEKKDIEFRLATYLITNKLRYVVPGITEKGNCCYWTSKGFKHIGLLQNHSNFPMSCWYKLLLVLLCVRNTQFKVVFYKGIHHDEIPKGTFLYPFYWLKHGYNKIWKNETLADLKIEPITCANGNYSLRVVPVVKNDSQMKWVNQCYAQIKKAFKIQ